MRDKTHPSIIRNSEQARERLAKNPEGWKEGLNPEQQKEVLEVRKEAGPS